MRSIRPTSLALVLLLLTIPTPGCDDGTGPSPRPDSSLEFVRFPTTPPLQSLEVSFWAVSGENREGVIRYLPERPGDEGEEFLVFRVHGNSLRRRPDGTRFERGDSVRITITMSDDGRVLLRAEPSGLVFDEGQPARLRIRYDRVGDDLNGDGVVDGKDAALDARMQMWKQEQPGEPWHPVGTVRVRELKEIEGRITGFTGFAVAG